MIDLRRILVPTDFSLHSHNALIYGAAFAEKFSADLYLLHVFQDLTVAQPEAVTVGAPIIAPLEQFLASARSALDRLIQENKLERIKVHPEVRAGVPVDEIIQFATDTDIDLIVMGTHGRGWLAHVLLGSVTEKVVRKAPCPVLTVRRSEHDFVKPD
jgi:nucleotide-binding universal stress UspA family protein